MAKPMKSEILRLSFIATLLIISPLIPTSIRPTYLYFLFNLLIIALGAEAGLLSFSKPSEDKKPMTITPKPTAANTESTALIETPPNSTIRNVGVEGRESRPKVVEKCSSEKIVGVVSKVSNKVKKCPSMPSIFFIGAGAGDEAEEVVDEYESHDEEEEKEEVDQGKELFTKAETFIGNFYKQLKMQREDSWKRIHGFYQKAF